LLAFRLLLIDGLLQLPVKAIAELPESLLMLADCVLVLAVKGI
jgi:hypothetical protein